MGATPTHGSKEDHCRTIQSSEFGWRRQDARAHARQRDCARISEVPLGPWWKERLTQPAGGGSGGSEGDEQRTGNFTVGGRAGSEGPALGAWREEGKEAFEEC